MKSVTVIGLASFLAGVVLSHVIGVAPNGELMMISNYTWSMIQCY